jgi:hypoxanthine phosphoribosyltransferase
MTSADLYRLHLLYPRLEIDTVVRNLAQTISRDYAGRDLLLVGVLKGAFIFLSDLARHLTVPAQIDFVRLASYGGGTRSSGVVEILKEIETPVAGKDVLIVEDIVDSGRTLLFLKDHLARSAALSVRVCTLLDKKSRREVPFEPDYVGKIVDDVFIVGYGLDVDEAYRCLPEIYYVTRDDPSQP